MAPKRGGGGGVSSSSGSGGGSSIENRCNSSDTIGEPIIIARLTLDGFALVYFLIIIYLWNGAKKRNPNLNQLLPWYTFGLLCLVTITYLILSILRTVFSSCFIIDFKDSADFSTSISVLSEVASVAALAIILLPVTIHLLKRTAQKTKTVKIINGCLIAIVTVVMIPMLIITNISNQAIFNPTFSVGRSLSSVSVKFATAYYCLYCLVAIMGSIILHITLIRAGRNMALSTKSKIWTIFTTAALCVGSLALAIELLGWSVTDRTLSDTAYIIFITIFQITWVLTVYGILQMASSATVPFVDPKDNATYDPQAPDGLHRRFTYTEPKAIQETPVQYEAPNAFQYSVPQQQWVPPQPGQFAGQNGDMDGRLLHQNGPQGYRA